MKKLSIQVIRVFVLAWLVFMFTLPASASPDLASQVEAGSGVIAAQALTPLDWAKRLIIDIKPERNAYASNPTYLKWKDVEGATVSKNRTVCSSFITRLLKQAYGYTSSDIKNWMGTKNPQAATYYDTIAKQQQFQLITQVQDIKPGDLLAIKYLENVQTEADEGAPETDENLLNDSQCPERSSVTGHIVLVRAAPIVRQSSAPIQSGLTQYSLKVIDSSRSGHGCQDTRLLPNKSCSDKDAWGKGGAGQGTMRLYANSDGAIAGYTWSLRAKSTYYAHDEYINKQGCQIPSHPLVVGRLLK